jgi:hypothetical protein
MKVDLSAQAITRRLQRVSELVRVCRALAGLRQKSMRKKTFVPGNRPRPEA